MKVVYVLPYDHLWGEPRVQVNQVSMHVHQRPPLKTINSVNDPFLFSPYEDLWGDPGPPGKHESPPTSSTQNNQLCE